MSSIRIPRTRKLLWALAALCLLLPAMLAPAQKKEAEIDWNKARELHRKDLKGLTLTKEEQAYLKRARELRRAQARAAARRKAKPFLDLVPLTDLKGEARYKGQDGGLYGAGRNTPPKGHLEAALREAAKVRPLDAEGKPSPDGKVVLISMGMSNTTQEFRAFMRLARMDRDLSPSLELVDGAQGGMDAKDWSVPPRRVRAGRPGPWEGLDQRLKRAGVTPKQVQVVWILQARKNPASLGEFPKHADELKGHLVVALHKLKERFPNLRLAYLSSRIYAGYAVTGLNPEPYAYESAFSVRGLIQDQIRGDKALNYDPGKGEVKAPLLLWGAYLWANGEKGRKGDDLVWKQEDLARDGTHPSASGQQKVGKQLLAFFKSDPTAKPWFVKAP
jgi:hypothetical protein